VLAGLAAGGSDAVAQPHITYTSTYVADGFSNIGGIAVDSSGNATLDFRAAGTQAANVCVSSRSYAVGDTCSVTVSHSPTHPGARYGAVVPSRSQAHPARCSTAPVSRSRCSRKSQMKPTLVLLFFSACVPAMCLAGAPAITAGPQHTEIAGGYTYIRASSLLECLRWCG
jgi:hypothetical protein